MPADATEIPTWQSYNPDIATVDKNGNVTAIKAGSARIAAFIANETSAWCTVSVYDGLYPPAGASYQLAYANKADGTVSIVGYTGTAAGELLLPSEIEGKTVTEIGEDAFNRCGGFTGNLTIPDTVTTIGSSAFDNCRGFTGSLTIPDSVTTIGSYAFSWCSGFTGNVTISSGMKTIGSNTFSYCSNITSMTIPIGITTIGDYAVSGCSNLKTVYGDTGSYAEKWAEEQNLKFVADFVGAVLGKTELSLGMGESEKLMVTVLPSGSASQTVTWSSSDASVATVDQNGKVTAMKTGTATITAKPEKGKSATCVVTAYIAATGISLDKTRLALQVGGTEKLTATIAPANATDKTLTWASDNSAVATVVDGKVTAVKAGTANITATSTNGKKATCAVTVKKQEIVEVTSVTLNKLNLSLTEGAAETLTATIAPTNATDKTLTWQSSNTAIATVDKDGKVTAVKAGTANITATSKNGKKATCAVTVKAKKPVVVEVTSVTLNKTALSLTEGDSETLTATIAPTNATDKTLTWASDNTAVATVANGKVTAIKAGTANITATSKNGKKATCAVTVKAKKPDVVEVTSVTLSETAFSMIVGESKAVTATVAPEKATDKTVTWQSSNETAASVADGNVKALKVGKTTITATSKNGKTASCEVLVKAVPEPGVPGFVERLYSVALGRESDTAGKEAWAEYLKEGKVTGAAVAKDFILSREMKNRNLSDAEFMATIYETFFNRAPDEAGLKGWMNFLESGMSREFVVANFAGGPEFQNICDSFGIKRGSIETPQPRDKNPNLTAFVNRLYTKLLDRNGEEAGLNNWCAAILAKTTTPKKIAHDFVFGPEFADKKFSNEKFIEYMYRTFMGREFDAAGKAAWMKAMNEGTSKEAVFNGFADSKEFANIAKGFGL